jgi:hypothetical protein
MAMVPSDCWWFSSRATIIRGIAHKVPFSVASGRVVSLSRMRILRRRAWNSVVFEVEVTSR